MPEVTVASPVGFHHQTTPRRSSWAKVIAFEVQQKRLDVMLNG